MPCLDHVVLYVAAYAVLRSEQSGQVYRWVFVKKVGNMAQVMSDGGLITYQAHSCPSKGADLRLK
jgi:hypothetical protein